MLPMNYNPVPNKPLAPSYGVMDYAQPVYSQKEVDDLNSENMKLQQEIDGLQEQIKKQKVHPINFTPPSIKLEITPKIYRFRHFVIKLTIDPSFGIQYTGEEVLQAITKAKIKRENDTSKTITTCWCSSNKEIIEVATSNQATIGPYKTEEGLSYVLDQCRSHCTSSRDHHHGRLVLVIDQLPGLPPLVSNGFELCARVKGSLPEEVNPFTKEQLIQPTPNVREKHRVDLQYDSVDLLFSAVFVFSTAFPTQQESNHAIGQVIIFLKSTEGFVNCFNVDSCGMYVVYCYYSTYLLSCNASVLIKAYLSNERPNFLNKDIHLSGEVRLLAVSL
ncbi:hypothetical protein EIN_058340 [Entamoeba invadens IP1]|uniref:hypothetical protein n=1 Tax=Entamoeba invadens IP1 TaxID=370355 RepID=UPI0002C3E0D7|nr:hypothetical protein EIN_058340 [Entamoeba invadens IP1]ELP93389.1 hypothetical protein EIN_058340 [Entamoeba invadens IP1]|eukprot:XP_004260160.1 hypothetical protein EIN_058340 [Entamoeba invadens IP1]